MTRCSPATPRSAVAPAWPVAQSFESYAHPGRYLRHYNFEVRVDWRTSDAAFARDASFTVSAPLA